MLLGRWVVGFAYATSLAWGQICIDPGHPSEVGRGTHGKKITEIQLVWRVATLLKARLEHDGYRVALTKSSEQQFVVNRRRAEIANGFHAKLMLRLHCDAQGGTGFAVYAPDRQGISGGQRGPSSSVILKSNTLATTIHHRLAESLAGKLRDNGLKPDTKTAVGTRQGALTGSIYSHVPVVLVEMCVLTNPEDEKFVTSRGGLSALVKALQSAVEDAVPLKH